MSLIVIDDQKRIGLIIGTLAGMSGFYYANSSDLGRYQIGVGRFSEISGLLLFFVAALFSREWMSIILLQTIVAWHLTCTIHYWDETEWF